MKMKWVGHVAHMEEMRNSCNQKPVSF